jgi:hypothetical protein
VGDAMSEDSSFSRSGTCHDQHWPAAVNDRVVLCGVQSFEDVVVAHRRVQVV